MRKPTLEPTDENILDTLAADVLGRNELLIDTIILLNNLEGNFTVALDSPWGGGKTFFVKQLQKILQYCIPDTAKEESVKKLADKAIDRGYAKEKLLIPIYFNAWIYDNLEDPMLPLLYTIADYKEGKLNASVPLRERLANLISSVSINIGPLSVSTKQIVDSLSVGESLIKPVIDQTEIKEKMYAFIEEALEYENSRLLLIIDELDRCRPTFAVEVLERVKHFYDNDNIITLYSLNKSQLVHTVAHLYGSNCNATVYLNRFFDYTFALPLSDKNRSRYIVSSESDFSEGLADFFSDHIIKYYGFSIRETAHYLESYKRARNTIFQESGILLSIYVPFLIALRIHDQQEYEKFISGRFLQPLRICIEDNEDIINRLRRCLETRKDAATKEVLDSFSETYSTIFRQDSGRPHGGVRAIWGQASKEHILELSSG